MKTRVFRTKDLSRAAALLKKGELIAFPTETVYGLGANALDERAVKTIFKAKGRPADNPLIVHIASFEQLAPLIETVPTKATILMEKFWPGPLSIVFSKSAHVPHAVTAGLSTVVVRMPSNAIAREFIRKAGVPIAAPSANRSGRPSPTRAQHVLDDLDGRIAAVVDGGPCRHGLESTVIDVRPRVPIVLRQGSVTLEALERVIGKVRLATHATKTRSPGMKYRHYAPKAKLILVLGKKDVVDEKLKDLKRRYPRATILRRSSLTPKNLFAVLRKAEEGVLLCPGIPEAGLGRTVMERLRRAATDVIEV